MRRILVASLVLAGLLAAIRPACAGVYNLSERQIWPLPTEFTQFQFYLQTLRSCDDASFQQPGNSQALVIASLLGQTTPLQNPWMVGWTSQTMIKAALKTGSRQELLEQLAQLEVKKSAGALCTLDLADMSGCLIRLGRNAKAVELLQGRRNDLAPDDPARFLLLANLATAYHNIGLLPRAIECQEQALAAWPESWPGWPVERNQFHRRNERYYLELLRSRNKEAGGKWTTVDNLFPGVTFEGPVGKYEAGAIPPQMFDRLPPDALFTVVQLLVWQPNDDRLLWLLAEILNADHQIFPAAAILKDLVFNRGISNVPELTRHRRVLVRATEVLQAFAKADQAEFAGLQLLWAVRPHGGLLSPGIGIAATEGTALQAAVIFQDMVRKEKWPPQIPPIVVSPRDDSPNPVPILLNWRQIIVSFIAGILTTILIRLQIIEWRRRSPVQAEFSEPPPSGPEEEPSPVAAGTSEKIAP